MQTGDRCREGYVLGMQVPVTTNRSYFHLDTLDYYVGIRLYVLYACVGWNSSPTQFVIVIG